MSELPYTAKAIWINKIVFIFLVIFMPLSLILFDTRGFWNPEKTILRVFAFLFYGVFCLYTFCFFIRKIEFTEDKIVYVGYFGHIKIKQYKEIVKAKLGGEKISIKFSDNSKIRVWIYEGDTLKILRIIEKKRDELRR